MVDRQNSATIETKDPALIQANTPVPTDSAERLALLRRLDQTDTELDAQRHALNAERRARLTAQRSLAVAKQKFDALYENSPVAYMTLDHTGRILQLNPAAAALLGAETENPVGTLLTAKLLSPSPARVLKHLDSSRAGESQKLEVTLGLRGDEQRVLALTSTRFKKDARRPDTILSAAFDVTAYRRTHQQLQRSHERMRHAAHHDPLTNLPNRLLFEDRLRHAMARARRNGSLVALMFVDLDRFKYVNDTLGHDAGDRLLMSVARRLNDALRESDTVARLGGDEFALILEGINKPEEALMVGEKIRSAIAEPYQIDGSEIYVSPSIGLSFFPEDATGIDPLLKCADLAMYRAKELGRDRLERYRPALDEQNNTRPDLDTKLEQALHDGQVKLHFDPILYVPTDRVEGFEAQLRWHHPEHGLLPMEQMLSTTQDQKLLAEIADEVLCKACAQISALSRRMNMTYRLAIDMVNAQILDERFLQKVSKVLNESGLSPKQLEFELSETALLQNYDLISRQLNGLLNHNIGITVSEFGNGHSSLGRLHRLPATKIKLSTAYINGLPFDQDNRRFVGAIVSMAGTLGIKIAAAGVENTEQARYLKQAGCVFLQGAHIGTPDAAKSTLDASQEILCG